MRIFMSEQAAGASWRREAEGQMNYAEPPLGWRAS